MILGVLEGLGVEPPLGAVGLAAEFASKVYFAFLSSAVPPAQGKHHLTASHRNLEVWSMGGNLASWVEKSSESESLLG